MSTLQDQIKRAIVLHGPQTETELCTRLNQQRPYMRRVLALMTGMAQDEKHKPLPKEVVIDKQGRYGLVRHG